MNPKSSIVIAEDVHAQVKAMRMDKKIRYIACALNGDKLEVKNTAPRETTYDDFLKALPKDEFRVFFYDYNVKGIEKLILIFWCPATLPAKIRIVANGVLTSCQSHIQGILKTFKAEEADEIDEATIQKAF